VRLYGPTGTRAFPTDRNPSTVAVGGQAFVNFGNTTVIASYTVPAGRRAEISSSVDAWVSVALPAGFEAGADMATTPNGGAFALTMRVNFGPAAPLNSQKSLANGPYYLKAGDLVQLRGYVGGGASGQVSVAVGLQGVEYDA